MSHDGNPAYATTFDSPDNQFTLSTLTPNSAYTSTSVYDIIGPNCDPAGTAPPRANNVCDSNFSANMTFTPPEFYVAHGTALPLAAKVGTLSSTTTLSFADTTPCDQVTPVGFVLLNASIDASDTIEPLAPGVSNRLQPLQDKGLGDAQIEDGIEFYPTYLNALFDPDGALGPLPPLIPRARYVGITDVFGDTVVLQFLIFNPGALTAFVGANHYLAQFGPEFGYPSVTVLQDPSAPAGPSAIADFCAPLSVTTVLLGQTLDNPATGADESDCNPAGGIQPCVRSKTARANTGIAGTQTHLFLNFARGYRDADFDNIENQLDVCPFNTNPTWNPREDIPNASDGDADGEPNDSGACADADDGTINTDSDSDGYKTRNDNCAFVPNGTILGADNQDQLELPGPSHSMGAAGATVIPAGPGQPLDGGPPTDGIGDACQDASFDGDYDGDGDLNAVDNCVYVANAAQTNSDADDPDGAGPIPGTGDACDPVNVSGTFLNVDGDGAPNATDDCPMHTVNGGDTDSDGIPDACDPTTVDTGSGDHDFDGDVNGSDNCNTAFNPGQRDTDDDKIGDACDPSPGRSFSSSTGAYQAQLIVDPNCIGGTDSDSGGGDGWCDATETLLGSLTGDSASTPENHTIVFTMPITEAGTSNGMPQACDDGVDNDGNSGADTDAECSSHVSPDADLDGIADGSDNCPSAFNPDQTNTDARHNAESGLTIYGGVVPTDSLGDACDPDSDGDSPSGFTNDFTDAEEQYWGTDPLEPCPRSTGASGTPKHDAWPPDTRGLFSAAEVDREVSGVDLLPLKNAFGADLATEPDRYNRRVDWSGLFGTPDFNISGFDLLPFKHAFNTDCTASLVSP